MPNKKTSLEEYFEIANTKEAVNSQITEITLMTFNKRTFPVVKPARNKTAPTTSKSASGTPEAYSILINEIEIAITAQNKLKISRFPDRRCHRCIALQ